jgi:uncharacterized Zn-finger protein
LFWNFRVVFSVTVVVKKFISCRIEEVLLTHPAVLLDVGRLGVVHDTLEKGVNG